MNDLPVYVVSDIHLGGVPQETERSFREFLGMVAGTASELLINGDLFDFWFEYRSVIPGRHYRVLAALADVVDAGVAVRFMGGNHDAWGGAFLRDEVGIELLAERAELDLAGRKALVVHGDGVGYGDLGYRILKRFIRHPITIRAFRALHPDLGSRVAALVSTTEAKAGNAEAANPDRARQLEEWACGELARRPELGLVLAGHTHTPVVREVGEGRFYVNTGDWINHFTYLVIPHDGPPELQEWPMPGRA